MAREAGFDNIGIDLIYGLPGQSGCRAGRPPSRRPSPSRPDHLSCYQLTDRGGDAPRRAVPTTGRSLFPTMRSRPISSSATSGSSKRTAIVQYEVSNFARRCEARIAPQQQILEPYPLSRPRPGGPLLRRPAGARWNLRSVDAYLGDLAAGRLPVAASELLTAEQLRLEALFLGFRTRRGINLEDFQRRFGQDLLAEKGKILKRLGEEGLVEIRDGFLRPTRAGMAVADSLALI